MRSNGAFHRWHHLLGITAAVLVLAACGSGGSGSKARSGANADSLFAHKTITILVGDTPGGNYDLVARALQKVVSQYLPGSPRVIVQNEPGGDHLVANRAVYAAKPDGLTIGMGNLHRWQVELLGTTEEGLDVTKVRYVGTLDADSDGELWCGDKSRDASWADIVSKGKTVTVAATAPGGAVFLIPEALQLQHQPVKVVYGYSGGTETEQAFGKGEVDTLARCAESYTSKYPDWLSSGKLSPLAWIGQAPSAEYLQKMGWTGPTPPSLFDLPGASFSDSDKAAVDDVLEMGRLNGAFFLPPNTPDNIVNAWVTAAQKATADPDFVKTLAAGGDTAKFAGADEIAKVFASMQGLSGEGKSFLQALAPVKSS